MKDTLMTYCPPNPKRPNIDKNHYLRSSIFLSFLISKTSINERFTALRIRCRKVVNCPSLNSNSAYHCLVNRFNLSLADINYNCPSLNSNSAYHCLVNRFTLSLADIKDNAER